jgi:hypothetical protein
MRSFPDSKTRVEREEEGGGHRIQNGWPVRREQKAASKDARFGVRFIQMYTFSIGTGVFRNGCAAAIRRDGFAWKYFSLPGAAPKS